MNRSGSGRNVGRKCFTGGSILIEVLLSVSILSITIVLMLQSLTASARAATKASKRAEMANLLENKMVAFWLAPEYLLKNKPETLKGNLNDYPFSVAATNQMLVGNVYCRKIILSDEWGQGRNREVLSLPLLYYAQTQ